MGQYEHARARAHKHAQAVFTTTYCLCIELALRSTFGRVTTRGHDQNKPIARYDVIASHPQEAALSIMIRFRLSRVSARARTPLVLDNKYGKRG